MSNVLISVEAVEEILNRFHPKQRIVVNSIYHYQTAFVRKSYLADPDIPGFAPTECGERLEFLGDAILGAVVTRYIFERFPDQQEGFLTKLRTKLVRSSMLAHLASRLGLEPWILVQTAPEAFNSSKSKLRGSQRVLEDTMESFVGAMMLDAGYHSCEAFVVGCLENEVDFAELIARNDNYKDTLQRYFQSIRWQNPVYSDIDEYGPSHNKKFVKGLLLPYEQVAHRLSPETIKQCTRASFGKLRPETADVVRQICAKGNTVLIGCEAGRKKNEVEQMISRETLINFGIALDF